MLNYQRVYFINHGRAAIAHDNSSGDQLHGSSHSFFCWYISENWWYPKTTSPSKKTTVGFFGVPLSRKSPMLVGELYFCWPRILAKFPELSQHPQVTAPSRQCSAPAARCPVFSHESGYFPRPPGLVKPLFMG